MLLDITEPASPQFLYAFQEWNSAPLGSPKKLPSEHKLTPQVRALYDPLQLLAHVGRNRMAVVQASLIHLETLLRLEDYEVRIIPRGQLSFPIVASGKLRRFLRHPSHDFAKAETSLGTFSPDDWKRQRQAGDPAPCMAKVSFTGTLHCRWTRGMIRDHHVDHAASQSLPQLLPVSGIANRRRAFALRGPVWNILGFEMQVMRASLHCDRKSCILCGEKLFERQTGCQMNNV